MAKPMLEGLPTELLIIILSQISDLDTLKSIVLSSPVCYRAYLTVRQEILHNILKSQYEAGLDLSEAIIAIRSKGLYLEYYEEHAIAILDRWRHREAISQVSSTSTIRIDRPDGLEEIIKLLQFHKKLQFFADDYMFNVPKPSWLDPDQWKQVLPIKLSENERRRFMRALCRLQIHAHIFGPPESVYPHYVHLNRVGNMYDQEKAYRLFFGAMPPWEYHEMGCVWSYLMTKYNPVFERMSGDLRGAMKNAPSRFFWDVLSNEEFQVSAVIDTVEDLKTLSTYTENLNSLGPDFLYRLLHATPIPQRNMVVTNLHTSHTPFIGLWIVSWDDRIPFTEPADRYEVRHFEQFWSTLPPLERPSLGWRKLGLVPHTPEQTLEVALDMDNDPNIEKEWPWGFALWDDARLKEWDAPLLREGRGDAPLLLLTAP